MAKRVSHYGAAISQRNGRRVLERWGKALATARINARDIEMDTLLRGRGWDASHRSKGVSNRVAEFRKQLGYAGNDIGDSVDTDLQATSIKRRLASERGRGKRQQRRGSV